jgi:hypothetical protein
LGASSRRLARSEQLSLCRKPILQVLSVCAAAFEKDSVRPQLDGLALQSGRAG